jgi:hypothetical protein
MRFALLLVGVLGLVACGPQAPQAPPEPEDAPETTSAQAASTDEANACPEILEGIAGEVLSLSLQHASGCVQDSDCVLVSLSISCLDNPCDMPVLREEVASFSADLSEYEAETCPSAPTTCGMSGNCAALAGAACVSGVCRPVVAAE